jgi:3' terminal RNA ribose 2'-O-methyltransferase Hen1
MLLTLTTTTAPARDLGFLLRKHPDRLQTFELSVGSAHVFYPEASDDRCTAALMLDVDPVSLVRGRPFAAESGLLESYVNDRPYAATSFMSVAIARIYGQTLGGRCDRPELVSRLMDIEAVVTPVRVGEGDLPERLFGPLGYTVGNGAVAVPEAARAGIYRRIALSSRTTLRELLAHLYVLIPVMDAEKHYWVGDAEVEKLLRHGAEWLAAHPERELITKRYLNRSPVHARAALARLKALDESEGLPAIAPRPSEASLERPMRLQARRIEAVVEALREFGATSVADLGCGEGDLLAAVACDPKIVRILGADVSARELERAKAHLAREPMSSARREAIELVQSSLLYLDRRLFGFDAATLLEVVEHVDPERLPLLERIVFAHIRPRVVIVTTPNREFNALFPSLSAGGLRHGDHRFEWTRSEFSSWATAVALEHRYSVNFRPIGDIDPRYGAPTQMAIFRFA